MSSDDSTVPVPDPSSNEGEFVFHSDHTHESKEELSHEETVPWIPGYRVLNHLGEGGFGHVYHAQQLSTGNEVAIKMLKKVSDRAKEEMDNEIRIISQLKNPYLVGVLDAGRTSDERPYFVMDFVNGEHLTDYTKRTRCSLKRILAIFFKLCQAVGHAHRKGVVHRDLKPSNIKINAEGDPKVLDFGLARVMAAPPVGRPALREIGGTIDYMSPEATRGNREEIDSRSDVYSLGVLLYQLLTGRLPYELIGDGQDKYRTIQEAAPIKPHSAWTPVGGVTKVTDRDTEMSCPIDADLERLMLKALSKRREDRFENGAAFAGAIEWYMRRGFYNEKSDPFVKVFWGRVRSLAGQHPAVSLVLNLILAFVISERLVAVALFEKTGLAGRYDAILARYFTASSPAPFSHMALVNMPTSAEMVSLAKYLEGASPETPRVGRLLDGQFMQRLAQAGCQCTVVWDACYKGDSKFDLDFVKGVEAIQKNGGAVVVAADSWWFDDPTFVSYNRQISMHPNIRLGVVVFNKSLSDEWIIPLVVQRELREPLPSLALAAYSAYLHPTVHTEFHLNPAEAVVTLKYYETHLDQPLIRVHLPDTDRVHLGYAQLHAKNSSGFGDDGGLQDGDWVGTFVARIPDDPIIASATIPFESAFTETSKMMDRFNGKIVFVGPLDSEIRPYVDKRQLSKALGHAATIDALMQQGFSQTLLPFTQLFLTGIGSIVGCLVGILFHGRVLTMGACIVVCVVGMIGFSMAWHWYSCVLWNPVVAVVAMLLAVVGSAAVMKRARRMA
ncbi:MAG: serine/threonine-protein kinase [Planctomycetota bacterium]